MLHPITLWLLAYLTTSLSPQLQTPNHYLQTATFKRQASPPGDSTVFRELQEQLNRRQNETAPEKLYLHLDRSLYQPGETAWFNAYIRNAGDLQPALMSQILYVELFDPKGSMVAQKTCLALDGTAAGQFDFPADMPGGMYRVKAYTRWMENTGELFERTITLQKVVLPNLNLKLEFERKAFGPGDVAIARFDAFSLDNKALSGRKVGFTAAVGGKQIAGGTAETDINGRAWVRFQLPENLETADGLLNITIEHEGRTEAISRAIPIVLDKIDLAFFPEGGDVVAGIPCRMAFKALNEFGKPADVEGVVLDEHGATVTVFASYHDGMGAFDYLPVSGKQYRVRLTKPVASDKLFDLPEAQKDGMTLRLQQRDEQTLTFEVSATQAKKVYLIGCNRDKPFFYKEIVFGARKQPANTSGTSMQKVNVPVKDLPAGIARFTLFDENKNERAERLAFVHRDKGLNISITPDKANYLPREKVNLHIKINDDAGRPVQGHFSLAVADEKQLTFADDKQGHLLASLLLEQDVKGRIEEPNFYFDNNEPKSAQALDYLLMTQGWRRFVWKEMLEANPVAYINPGEQATIAGTVHRKNGKPLQWATVSLFPNGPSVETDKNGRFSFKNVDIEKYTHLHYWRDEYFMVNWYDSNIALGTGSVQSTLSYQPASAGATHLRGKVLADDGEPLIGASVIVVGTNRGAVTDVEGNYILSNIPPGTYDIEFHYTGYSPHRTTGVRLINNQIANLNTALESGTVLQEVSVTAYKVPLIEQDKTMSGQALTAEQIRNLPTRNLNAIVATTAGTTAVDDETARIRGSRSNETNYYIDGIRVSGTLPPVQDIESLEVVTGGLGAEFGEFEADAFPRNREEISAVEISAFKVPMVEQDKTSGGQTLSSNQLVPRSKASKSVWKKDEEKKRIRSAKPARPRAFDRAREFYTPQYHTEQGPAKRSDFRSTIYWNPDVQTNRQGEATVAFYASDAITNFRATLEGIGNNGLPGHAEQKFFVQKPLGLAVKVPASVISGDEIDLQIAVSNKTGYPSGGHLDIEVPGHFTAIGQYTADIQLAAGETRVISARYGVGMPQSETGSISIRFSADENVLDAFESSIRTLDRGYPVRQVAAGSAAQNLFNIHLHDPVQGTLSATLTAYPNALEDVLKNLERMLRQPSGCFEQVSSSNYPNLLVLDLLRQTGTARPEVESKARKMLEDGYKQLTAYECKSGGFDWWGRDPAHEGLTAYGILEFTDMAKVFAVDKELINRTVQWLDKRRDGKGGWTLNPSSSHGWDNDPVLNCYIVWALAEAGYGRQFSAEMERWWLKALQSNDPYQEALMANALLAAKDVRGLDLVKRLLEQQDDNGSWKGSTHSVLHATGTCFQIETTALVALALLKSEEKTGALSKAIDFLIQSKTEYGYGSTQSTVMALKALVEYAKTGNQSAADGMLVVQVDGRRVVEQPFSTKNPQRLEIKNLEQFFTNDNPQVDVFFENPRVVIPFDIEVKYASRMPRNKADCPLSLRTSLGQAEVKTGETVRLSTVLENTGTQAQASPMVVLGIPAGLSLQPWQLKKLVEEKKCDYYELWDGFAVFHFEQIGAGESRELNLDLRADIAGAFEAPASQAFLYYSNDQRVWSKPERIVVSGE